MFIVLGIYLGTCLVLGLKQKYSMPGIHGIHPRTGEKYMPLQPTLLSVLVESKNDMPQKSNCLNLTTSW